MLLLLWPPALLFRVRMRIAPGHHEVADGPDDLPLQLPPLQRRPLLLGAVAADTAVAVLAVVLHGSQAAPACSLQFSCLVTIGRVCVVCEEDMRR